MELASLSNQSLLQTESYRTIQVVIFIAMVARAHRVVDQQLRQ